MVDCPTIYCLTANFVVSCRLLIKTSPPNCVTCHERLTTCPSENKNLNESVCHRFIQSRLKPNKPLSKIIRYISSHPLFSPKV